MSSTGTALAVHQAKQSLTATQKDDLWAQAQALMKANLYPNKYDSAEQAFVVALYGHELGLSPQRSWAMLHIIEGQPAPGVHQQVTMVKQAIPGLIWRIPKHDTTVCVIEHGRPGEPLQSTEYTIEEAKMAGLVRETSSGKKNTWMKSPKDMLYCRAAGRAVRWFYPETQGGGLIYNDQELRDALVPAEQVTTEAKREEAKASGPAKTKATVPDLDTTAPAPAASKVVDAESEPAEPAISSAVATFTEHLETLKAVPEIAAAYQTFRQQNAGDSTTLLQGYEAQENRLKAISQAPQA